MASTVSPFKRNAAPAANKTSSMGLLGTNAAREGFFRQTSTHERDRSRRSKISTEEQLNNLLHSHDGHRYRLDRDWRGVEGITTLLYELKDELKEANESGCRPRSSIEAWATVLQANRQQQPLESLQSSYPALVAYPAAERQQHTVSEVSSQPSNLPVPDTRATAHDGQGARKDQHDAQRTPRELELEKKYKLLIQQFKDVGVALAKSRNGLEQAEHEIRVSEAKTAELSARHQKAERRLFAIRGELESKLLRIQDELKGQMIQLSQRHLSQEEKFTETISRLESLFQNQLKSQQEASVAEMDALRKTSACQRDELVQKYTTAMDELKRRFSYQSEELKCYYDSQLAANKQELQKADEGMRRMMSELDAERHDFKNEVAHLKKNAANPEELEALKRAHEELNRGHEELSRGHEELKRAHGEEVASVKEDCERKIEQCRQRFNTQVENNNREYMKHLDRLRAMKKQSEREHKEELARLELTFLGNERRNEKWTDVLLSSKFRDLQQLIDSAISPDQLVIDDRQIVAACRDIDPTNFIRRRGASAENFYALVKSSVWSILISEFFSEPFGFGAMGQSDGRASLMAVYKHWRVLLNGYHGWYGPSPILFITLTPS